MMAPATLRCSLTLVLGGTVMPAQWPARKQNAPVLLVNATVHPVTAPAIEKGAVLFVDGKITAVGKELTAPAGARRIDLEGKHVYPGMIAANTLMGLVEIGAIRATRDFAEAGEIKPEVRAEVSFHPDSKLIPVARANGVALALVVPDGGLISGSSALMQLDGWTWEGMLQRAPVGIHVRWPSMRMAAQDGERRERERARDRKIQKIHDAFTDAAAYLRAKRAEGADGIPHHDDDRRWEALRPALAGEIPVFVHADEVRQIQAACDFAKAAGLKLVIVGGRDAWRVTGLLRKNRVPVIVAGVHRLPARRFAGYDEPFTLPKKLFDAGVLFCIAGNGGASGTSNARNLPYHAATAVAYGLPREEALKAVTANAATILGVGDHLGSIEKGKDATLIVTSGDPLDIRSKVTMEFIAGREVDLDSHHEQLYRRYREKYRRLGLGGW